MGTLEQLTNNQIANRTSEAKRLTGGWLITLGGHGESEDRKDEENGEERETESGHSEWWCILTRI